MPQVLNNFKKPNVSECCCKGFDDTQSVMQTAAISSSVSTDVTVSASFPQKESSRTR